MATEIKSFLEEVVAEPAVEHKVRASQTSKFPVPEIQTIPQFLWTRIEKPLFGGSLKSILCSESGRTLITLKKIHFQDQTDAMDTSIRLRVGNVSYFLRHDVVYGGEDYEGWELIKTVPAKGSSGGEDTEQVVFDKTETVPEIILDDTQAPEWRLVVQYANALISTLPPEYPEKDILQQAWAQVTITDKTTQMMLEVQDIASEKQREIADDKERWQAAYPKIREPSPFQRLWNRIKSPFTRLGR